MPGIDRQAMYNNSGDESRLAIALAGFRGVSVTDISVNGGYGDDCEYLEYRVELNCEDTLNGHQALKSLGFVADIMHPGLLGLEPGIFQAPERYLPLRLYVGRVALESVIQSISFVADKTRNRDRGN